MTSHINDLSPEVLQNVLSSMSYSDIMAYCSTNRYARSICMDDQFWINKLGMELGDAVIQYITHYSHPDTLGLDIYRRWISMNSLELESYIKNGYNDMVIFILETRNIPNINIIPNIASKFTNIEVLEWFERKEFYQQNML